MKPKVLIVDDKPFNIELLEGFLTKDYDILKAGYEVCRKLKNDPQTVHIPIVMVTALTEIEDRIKAIEVGADDFLSKPIDHFGF